MAFLAQKLIYAINVWFNFVLGSFFKQDHLLKLIMLGVYRKRWPKCARISKQKLMYLKIWLINFSQTGAVRGSFHWKNFKWKKTWGYGVNFWENKNLYLELNERAEAAISSFSVPGDFLQYIYSVLVARNQKKFRSRCSGHEFPFTDIFNNINQG